MTIHTFEMPDLGEGLTQAEVVRWLVAVGDDITVDQPIVEVETEKSLVEVPSPYAGRVSVLHGEEGTTIDVGRPLIAVESGEAPPPAAPDSAVEQQQGEQRAGSGNVLIGYGTAADASSTARRRRPRAVTPASAPPAQRPVEPARSAPTAHVAPRVASPLVRRIARDAGIAVASVTGTGPDGLITRSDVEAAIAAATHVDPTTPELPEPASRTGVSGVTRTPISGFRKAVSATLTRSRRDVPEATVWVDIDFTDLFALRASVQASDAEAPGLLAYLARFTSAALQAHPVLNGEIDTDRDEFIQYDSVNLGLAVQTDRGLLVPAVMNADTMTTPQLHREILRVTNAARTGRATHAELTAGTFTLNNYGAFNVDGSAAIINHPQVGIVGFGRVIDRPWVISGALAVRKIGQMSLVFDHRACDGGTAAAFMRAIADAIEAPREAICRLQAGPS